MAFAEVGAKHDEPKLFGETDGKTVGTYLEHNFHSTSSAATLLAWRIVAVSLVASAACDVLIWYGLVLGNRVSCAGFPA